MKVLIVKDGDVWVRPGAYDMITSEKGHRYAYLDCNDRFVMIRDRDGNLYVWSPTAFHGLIVDESDTRGRTSQEPTYTLFLDDVLTILDALDYLEAVGQMSTEERKLRASMTDWLNSVTADMVDG